MKMLRAGKPIVTLAGEACHSNHSSLRESILEHLFLGELLRSLWCSGVHRIELLRAEVDAAGYDLVLECAGVMRHIQLKSSFSGSKTARVNVNTALAAKPSGCVIWIVFNTQTMKLEHFYWLGSRPGRKIPDLGNRIGRHTKGTSVGKKNPRPEIRVIGKRRFKKLPDVAAVARELMGRTSKSQ
jgi:hypothetical protein